MATLNDIDFGSESDEGDFNPAPQAPSDDEDVNEQQRSGPGKKGSRRASPAARSELDEEGEDGENVDENGDDLDEDDEDEDEEDEIPVSLRPSGVFASLISSRAGHGNELDVINAISSSISKPR